MYILDQEYMYLRCILGIFSNVFKYIQDCAVHSGVYLTCILPVYCQCIHVVYVFNVYSGSIKILFRTVFQYIQAVHVVGKCSVSDAKVTVYSYCIQENTFTFKVYLKYI